MPAMAVLVQEYHYRQDLGATKTFPPEICCGGHPP